MSWQHVFQVVVCVLSAVQRAARHPVLIKMHDYWLFLQKCNFNQAQCKLPEDSPSGPKHVGANVGFFNVNCNILCLIKGEFLVKKEFWRYQNARYNDKKVLQLFKKKPSLMEHKYLLKYSECPATCPYPET